MEYLTNLLANNAVIVLLVLIVLFRPQLFEKLLSAIGAGRKNGNTDEVTKRLDLITDNHLHEVVENLHDIKESLNRLDRRLEKLDSINEGIVHIKAKINGKT